MGASHSDALGSWQLPEKLVGSTITTRARRDGDHYVLNGAKMWISGVDRAKWGIVFARMEGVQGRAGITSFIVETDRPGFSIRKIADSEIELRAARLLTYQAAWQADLGHNAKVDSSICKVYATETSFRVLDRCIQIFGGLGVSHELPLERWFREARIRRIGEGPSEVHRMVVAREMLAGRESRRSVA